MSQLNGYTPPQKNLWVGREDGPRFHHQVELANLEKGPHDFRGKWVLLGFASDEGVRRNLGRPGAQEGPQAIRGALSKLAVHETPPFIDGGTLSCNEGNLEEAQSALSQAVAQILQWGGVPLVLGGGHETSWGHYQGLEQGGKGQGLGIINVDAHFDLRPLQQEKGSSGTPFLQIAERRGEDFHYFVWGLQPRSNTAALLEKARHTGTQWIEAKEIATQELHPLLETALGFSEPHSHLYLSLCLDAFSCAHAPGVSAPQPLGLTPWEVLPLMETVLQTGKVCGVDIVELNPQKDLDGRTAQLAAHLVAEILSFPPLDRR